MTVLVSAFQWIFWRRGARRRYSARRCRPLLAGGDRFFPAVDVEAAVFPGEELGGLVGAEELGFAEDVRSGDERAR